MKNEKILNAIGNINDEMILNALEESEKEALERAEALETEDGIYSMSGVEEAEEFLGVSLPENTLLEDAYKLSFDVYLENGECVTGNTITFLLNNVESKLVAVWVESRYLYNGMDVWVNYKLVTELNPYEDGGGMAVETDENHEQTKETYVTATGRECTIIFSDDEKTCAGYAYMDIDGVLTAVEVVGGRVEDVRNCLYQIVDAYQ